MAMIEVRNVSKWYGDFQVLKNCSVSVEKGEVVVVCGPSGSGKSTLIKTVNALEPFQEGEILVNGVSVGDPKTDLAKLRSHVGMVFQHFELFPHLSIIDNLRLAQMKVLKRGRDEATERGLKLLDRVGLLSQAEKFPGQLSGGQQQRVALARALVIEPSVLLFDEPLSNLDAKLRVSMRTEIRRIQQEVGITAIYVTHDQSEAMALSDQIIIMNKGVVAQIGTPQEIYYHPVSEFVADFIGEANFLRGKMTGTENGLAVLDVEGERLAVAPREGMRVGEEYTVVLRPESAALSDEGGLPCTVELSCFMGSYQNYHVRVGNTLVKLAENDPRNKRIFRVGEQCHLTFAPDAVHVL